MKDVFSKVTFGFVMAQLVPGAIAFLGFGLIHAAVLFALSGALSAPTVVDSVETLINHWTSSVPRQVGFVAVCIGLGMLIHGLHWSVLGFLELKCRRVGDSFWHRLPVALQVLLGPVKIVAEVIWLLVRGKNITDIAMEENVPGMSREQMEAFAFLQEFYLHFAQFYAHSSYALVIVFCGLLSFLILVGVTLHTGLGTIVAWLLAGLCFVLGRIQLASMFKGERAIIQGRASDQR